MGLNGIKELLPYMLRLVEDDPFVGSFLAQERLYMSCCNLFLIGNKNTKS